MPGHVRTELEIRFVVDVTRPLSEPERVILTRALDLIRQCRSVRQIRGAGDVDLLESHALPPDPTSVPLAAPVPLRDARALAERRDIEAALAETDGHYTCAARLLNISRMTLRQKMREHGVSQA